MSVCVSGPVQYSVTHVLHCDGQRVGTTRCFSCEGVREVGSWVLVDRDQRMLNGTGCKMKMKVFDLRRCSVCSVVLSGEILVFSSSQKFVRGSAGSAAKTGVSVGTCAGGSGTLRLQFSEKHACVVSKFL
jgi:hypothetical protein